MRLEWNYRESQSGRYWLELLDNDGKVIRSVMLVDCQHDSMGYRGVIKYKFSGVTILDDITLDEAKKEVEKYFLRWWEKQLARAERDYDEAYNVVEYLKGEMNGVD